MKFYLHDAGHMTKMAAMPIYGKNPSKIFSWTSGLISKRTLYVASGTTAHHSLLKWRPLVDLDLFNSKVKFWNLSFLNKVMTVDFSETIAACDLKVGRWRQFIKLMTRVFKVKVISIWILELVFLRYMEKKLINMMLVTWPRWPPCPYMVKSL